MQQGLRRRRQHGRSAAVGGGGSGSSSSRSGSPAKAVRGNGPSVAQSGSSGGLSARLLAAAAVYAALALLWATNPRPASFTWGGAALGRVGWLAAQTGLGYRLHNLHFLSLLEVPPLRGAAAYSLARRSAWHVGALGRWWGPLPRSVGAALGGAGAVLGLLSRHGPWFVGHAARFLLDCFSHMLPGEGVAESRRFECCCCCVCVCVCLCDFGGDVERVACLARSHAGRSREAWGSRLQAPSLPAAHPSHPPLALQPPARWRLAWLPSG